MNNGYSIGDLSRSLLLSASNRQLRASLVTLSDTVTTGRKPDIAAATGGNLAPLAQLDAALSRLDAHSRNTAQATLELAAVQDALAHVQAATDKLGADYLAEAGRGDWTSLSGRAGQAVAQMDDVLSALRTRAGERFLLGGTATDRPPVGNAAELLGAVRDAAVGATIGDRIAAIDTYFDAPAGDGGFVDDFYAGSDRNIATGLSDQRQATNTARADDPALRDILRGLALAAMAAEPGTTREDGLLLMQKAGAALTGAQQGLVWMRAAVGLQQQVAADAETANDTARTSLTLSRNAIVAADPYEAATALEETQTRLESLYALTARLSRLSLTDYLR